MRDLARLILRLVTGSLMAGHGAQKLFGAFGGYGLEGTGGWLESMGLRPGERWAMAAGGSEFAGGLLTALGLFHPLGSLGTIAAMVMAATTAHANKPIWSTAGGAELPVINMSTAGALALVDPGRFSLDRAFGIRLPSWFVMLAVLATAAGIAYAHGTREVPAPQAEPATEA